jgi:hypothetical protein
MLTGGGKESNKEICKFYHNKVLNSALIKHELEHWRK